MTRGRKAGRGRCGQRYTPQPIGIPMLKTARSETKAGWGASRCCIRRDARRSQRGHHSISRWVQYFRRHVENDFIADPRDKTPDCYTKTEW